MISFTKKNNMVKLTGQLSIEDVADAKTKLEKALASSGTIKLKFDAVERIDLAFLQIIHAMYNSAKAAQKKVELIQPIPEIVTQVIQRTGLGYLQMWQTN
ncbi:STAS domain-containing protein [candidate division KSB1 bacterium]|nr:STAS domain-containing protein [candidate division KSB1 bacterium]